MDLSIVVVSYNTRELLLRCLRALPAATAGLRREVVVVDNASADGSPAAVRAEFPDLALIANAENVGFARASNQGVRALGRGETVLFLNSDTEPRPGSLTALVRYLCAHPRAGAAGPRLAHPGGGSPRSCFRFPSLTRPLLDFAVVRRLVGPRFSLTYPLGDRRLAEGGMVDWLSGACLLVRRRALDAAGRFDERYFMYFEDTDLCRRLWAAGWEVHFWPGAEVLHVGGASAGRQAARLGVEIQRSRLIYFSTYHRGLVSGLVRLETALGAVGRGIGSLARLRPRGLRTEAQILRLALRGAG